MQGETSLCIQYKNKWWEGSYYVANTKKCVVDITQAQYKNANNVEISPRPIHESVLKC